MDLNSYAELAVRLVNTAGGGGEDGDRLVNLDGLRALVADREHLNTGVTRNDLDALRALRSDFRAFFVACAAGDGEDAAAQLNALLIQHPVHPQLSGHDGQQWHVHYTESGSVADKYAAGAVMGLAVRLTDLGLDRFDSEGRSRIATDPIALPFPTIAADQSAAVPASGIQGGGSKDS